MCFFGHKLGKEKLNDIIFFSVNGVAVFIVQVKIKYYICKMNRSKWNTIWLRFLSIEIFFSSKPLKFTSASNIWYAILCPKPRILPKPKAPAHQMVWVWEVLLYFPSQHQRISIHNSHFPLLSISMLFQCYSS